jgi:hypothetical protein
VILPKQLVECYHQRTWPFPDKIKRFEQAVEWCLLRPLGKCIESREVSIDAKQAGRRSKDRSLRQLLQSGRRSDLPTKNDYALRQMHRSVRFAGKPGSYRFQV